MAALHSEKFLVWRALAHLSILLGNGRYIVYSSASLLGAASTGQITVDKKNKTISQSTDQDTIDTISY